MPATCAPQSAHVVIQEHLLKLPLYTFWIHICVFVRKYIYMYIHTGSRHIACMSTYVCITYEYVCITYEYVTQINVLMKYVLVICNTYISSTYICVTYEYVIQIDVLMIYVLMIRNTYICTPDM